MRYVCLDTETTGSKYYLGHRIIELGCVEVICGQKSGRELHMYFNPDRRSDFGAFRVHKISDEFLLDKPRFADCVDEIIDFLYGSTLVIHNAPFDMGFLNYEFKISGQPKLNEFVVDVIDTVILGRMKLPKKLHPNQRYSLDALYKTLVRSDYNPALHRNPHGALIDARMLADLFIRLNMGQEEIPI
ncbi:DNA polymerase III subunit epsilon [Taylorella equigenitalis]|uniref:DNA-directed DNA polymerase n=2 Tax=Taylorella equigenitalis TaxID=29575 RepID=A0A654KIY3_TAYEM|nr:DNA polymerase III subunit epsilon [Taylorella equigenitalis]ADU91846.1 DNA polymerase III epsilon subunit [Taylorella equigenitalis MCE9]AFN35411.1 DNA polymerase III, epsilon subunit [Taylorella equigenitalis ATCC 35865]ASY30069.1 DNA polymerase III subunit epsilon [Taylorella equigenitalis]ASY38841.1 DNA polymerase III subunit epsilon [Taylorella equigenitalis]ASY40365.1 DNA polymerase III subunit epsilon [Taylorella equigenitalis]